MARRRSRQASQKNELDSKRIGLSAGILWSIYILTLAVCSWFFNWGSAAVHLLSSLYPGYEASLRGIILGVIWAFLDGFVAGYLFSYIYNWIGRVKVV